MYIKLILKTWTPILTLYTPQELYTYEMAIILRVRGGLIIFLLNINDSFLFSFLVENVF